MLKSIHSAKILLTKDLKDKPALNLALSQGNIWKDLPLKIVFKTFPFTIETTETGDLVIYTATKLQFEGIYSEFNMCS